MKELWCFEQLVTNLNARHNIPGNKKAARYKVTVKVLTSYTFILLYLIFPWKIMPQLLLCLDLTYAVSLLLCYRRGVENALPLLTLMNAAACN